MSEQLEFYSEQARQRQFNTTWLSDLQQKALDDFCRLGFPTKKNEEWKYTSTASFLQHEFKAFQDNSVSKQIKSDIPVELSLDIINGLISNLKAIQSALPKGVIVTTLEDALANHQDLIKPYLSKIFEHEHGFQALNTAMMHAGVFIYLPKHVELEQPLLLNHWQDVEQQAVHLRHVLVAEPHSSMTVIEQYRGHEGVCYFTNVVTEVYAASSAKVSHYKIQQESKRSYHIGHFAAKLMAKSEVNSHSVSFGGKLVRSDVIMDMFESQSKCLMNGIYAPGAKQHIDHHTLVEHRVPDCLSVEDYKGILAGDSRAVFNGKVKVAKDAQKTEAQQQNKNLLLSTNAEVDTKPQLEIFADDVVCSHGATVGQLDEDALFYLATRGIGRAEASRFLIQAFAAENLKKMDLTVLSDWIQKQLNQHLG
tara:strand:+ start:1328 stop:2593 length:1266 start_codon:yes stop_codon:yes gene_type:complete